MAPRRYEDVAVLFCDAAWRQVKDRCRGRSFGFVEFKGKGRVELIQCHQVQ